MSNYGVLRAKQTRITRLLLQDIVLGLQIDLSDIRRINKVITVLDVGTNGIVTSETILNDDLIMNNSFISLQNRLISKVGEPSLLSLAEQQQNYSLSVISGEKMIVVCHAMSDDDNPIRKIAIVKY